jgi:alpha-beta hydrolase superfamily lysophospholipase
MIHKEKSITANDGTKLYWQAWEPETPVKATVCLVHGLGEHAGRYSHVASVMTAASLSMHAIDLRGHGRSDGPRGHTPSFMQWLDDLDLLINSAHPDLPIFLYGHSLGGLIVVQYTMDRAEKIRGVIATGPAFERGFEIPAIKIIMGRVMSGIMPTFSQHSGLNPYDLSRDESIATAYIEDPLVHDWASARLFVEITDAMESVMSRAAEFTTPILFMSGEQDRLTVPAKTEAFYQVTRSEDKTLRVWPDQFHEVHNELEKEFVIRELVDWIVARV